MLPTHRRSLLVLTLAVLLGLLAALPGVAAAPAPVGAPAGDVFGYGVAMIWDSWAWSAANQMGFNWVQTYNPPTSRHDASVLQRVKVSAFYVPYPEYFREQFRALVSASGAYIDAYEIGNEVNLALEWGAPPSAADYVGLLQVAREVIDESDPSAKLISAGLSTVGRVPGSWNGHPGHNGSVQDEREFLKEFIAAGGPALVNGIGYHPMGFRADFSAAPDASGGTPETDCSNGLCFRSVEKFHQILADAGMPYANIWATEFGWIVTPPASCESHPSWEGRLWQAVTPQAQADNLVGAFQYARANWPWMQAMFVWNLELDTLPYYDECEQMTYYSILGRPAERALRILLIGPKIYLPVLVR